MSKRVMSHFSVKKILSHSAEKIRRGALYCVTNAGIEKFYASEGYVTIFCRIFCLTVPKKFVEGPFSAVFQIISGSEKVYGKEGGEVSRFSFEKFLSDSAEKIRRGTLLCCVSDNFW